MNKHANTVPSETPCITCGAPCTQIIGGLPFCDACQQAHPQEKAANIYDRPNDSK
jgi:hypothetical protein